MDVYRFFVLFLIVSPPHHFYFDGFSIAVAVPNATAIERFDSTPPCFPGQKRMNSSETVAPPPLLILCLFPVGAAFPLPPMSYYILDAVVGLMASASRLLQR